MTDEAKKLVEALREDVEWARSNEWEIPITLGDHLEEAADLIEKLSAQLVNQATEYSRALKITTEQRDMLMGTQDKLAALLSYVTGGRFSKTSYSIDEMERFVDDYQQSECAKCDELEQVKVERDAVPKWISVKDRLPEPFKLVIVCRQYGKDFWKVEQGQLTVNGWWKVYGTNLKSSVTHWMPLPEPPGEDS